MHPSSLLSYYPTYSILDEILSYGNYKEINLFVDLKNCLQTLYQEFAIVNIIENSMKSEFVDSSVFVSLLSFLSFHKIYSLKREVKINFYIFLESGISYYHQNISKKYKMSRRIDDLYGLPVEKREIFFKTLQNNWMLIEKVCNRIPNTKVIRLLNLEADFVPYFLVSRGLVNTSEDVVHVVYSNDHDLLQTITASPDVFVFQKIPQKKRIIKKNEVMKHELKTDTKLPDNVQPLSMAILGDSGDDIHGVHGIGGKRFISLSKDLLRIIESVDKLYDNVIEGKPIFDVSQIQIPNKYLSKVIEKEKNEKLISNNLKLLSFEIISRFFENPDSTEMLERRDKLIKLVTEPSVPANIEKIKKALDMNRVFLGEELDVLYYGT